MTLRLGSTAPDFEAETTVGPIRFHDWIGDNWCILFSHPKDFTPVCSTELGSMASKLPEFERRGVKVIGISTDPLADHIAWSKDVAEVAGAPIAYPLIADTGLVVTKKYGMLPATAKGSGLRSAADNSTVRGVFVIAPDKTIQLMMTYPMSTGRNFAELLRAIDALQLSHGSNVVTPADWSRGDEVLITYSLSDDEARQVFPNGWRAPKPYIRYVPEPA